MGKRGRGMMECKDSGIIKVPTGFLGLGEQRYFQKDKVKVIEEHFGSCSACVGSPILFETEDGETLKGYEQFNY